MLHPRGRRGLETQIFGAFLNFARTGVPSQESLPVWPTVTQQEEPTMIFDTECQVRRNYDDELLMLIDSCLPAVNLMDMMETQDMQLSCVGSFSKRRIFLRSFSSFVLVEGI